MAVQRIPPSSVEAEAAVLGALLIDHEAINTVTQTVKPDFFYDGNNKLIYECGVICGISFLRRKDIN